MTDRLTPWTDVEVAPSPLGLAACVVGTGILADLETEHRQVFEAVARKTRIGDEALTREVPSVSEASLAHLDEHGVVRVGTQVGAGDILVGLVGPRPQGDLADRSVRVPPGVQGIVTVARLEPTHKDEVARALVEVSWIRPLEVGDILVDDRGQRAVVADIRDLASDLLWGDEVCDRQVAKVAMARDRLHARSVGPYSLVTQRPQRGQQVSPELLATLIEAGNPWAAWELLTLKSDSVSGRLWTYECLVQGQHPTPREGQTPESVLATQRELGALAFATDLEQDPVRGAWMTTEQVREASHGRVRKPETINYRTFLPERDGLFCQRIFGPVRDYACACGKYQRMKHRGHVCEDCGVEVIASRVRRERFGHVELPIALPHPWRLAELAELLGSTEPQIRDELAAGKNLREALGRDWDGFLEALPVLPPDLRPLVPLDGERFAVSDFNDFYRRLINRCNRLARLIELDAPEVIVLSESAMLYEAVESLFDNSRARKIVHFQDRRLRSLRDAVEDRLGPDPLRKTTDYSGVAHLVVDPRLDEGTCRIPRSMALELLKPWAYGVMAARGQVTTIKGAKAALLGGDDRALAALADVAAVWPLLLVTGQGLAARRIELGDAPAVAVGPETFAALGAEEVIVHVPLTEPAVQAARGWGIDVIPITAAHVQASGWLTEVMIGGDLPKALMAAAGGAVDPVDDPVLRLGLGRPPGSGPAPRDFLTDELISRR